VWDLLFTPSEYATRLTGVRVEMARREIDLLYVSSPANLNYLLGHRAVCFDSRNVTGLATPAADAPPIYFDTYDHTPGWPSTIADAVEYGEHGFYYPEGPQTVADTLKTRG